MATPLNPSDLYAMKGMYDDIIHTFEYPLAHGNEAAGIVIRSDGDSYWGPCWLGKRVACVRKSSKYHYIHGGSYQQYMIADAGALIELPDDVSFEKGCMFFVNPLTSIGLVERIKEHG